MRYRDQLKEARNWALVESGYKDDLPANEKLEAKKKADELFAEVVAELELIEQEEEENYARYDRRRKYDDAA
jgi:hypothetical protein